MKKLGLIAGGGELPLKIIQACVQKNIPYCLVALEGQTDPGLVAGQPHGWFPLGAVGKIITYLKENGVDHVVMIGPVRRPSWAELQLDWMGVKWLAQVGLKSRGDDGLLSAAVGLLNQQGLQVIRADEILGELLTPPGVLTVATPNAQDEKDMAYGCQILSVMGPLDIGQAVVIQDHIVLGIEAVEGTEALLKRCATLKRNEGQQQGVLVKIAKPGQDLRVDLPTIGPETILQAAEARLSGIALQAQRSQIIRQTEVVRLANEAGLFLMGLQIPEGGAVPSSESFFHG